MSNGTPRAGLPGASTFTSLGERDFRWFFYGTMAFFMAMQMQFVLRGYLAYQLTESASALGLVAISITLPMLIAAPIAGVIADRVDKKTLLIISQLLAALASIAVTALIVADLLEFWHLLAVSLTTGVVFSFNMPARAAIVPLLVPRHMLLNAVSLQAGAQNLTRIIAPAAGGILIAPLGAGWVYMLTGVLFLVSVACELRLPSHPPVKSERTTSFFAEFKEGLRYVTKDRLLGTLVLTSILVPFFAFPIQQLMPIFAEDVFDVGATGLGLLAAAAGAGGLIGAMISANMERQAAKGKLMLGGGILMAVFLGLLGLTPIFLLALLFIMISGIGQMIFQNTNNAVMQMRSPVELRGRVNSLMLMSFGTMPLGVLPVSAAADEFGVQATVVATAVILIVVLALIFATVKSLRELRVEPSQAPAHAPPPPGTSTVAAASEEGMDTQTTTPRQAAGPALPRRSAG